MKRWTGWLVALLLWAKDLHDVGLFFKRMADYRAPASAPRGPTSACQEGHETVEAERSADDIPDGPVTITSDDGGLQCYSCKRRPSWPRVSGPTVNLPRDHVEGYGFGPFVCVDCRDAGLWEPIITAAQLVEHVRAGGEVAWASPALLRMLRQAGL